MTVRKEFPDNEVLYGDVFEGITVRKVKNTADIKDWIDVDKDGEKDTARKVRFRLEIIHFLKSNFKKNNFFVLWNCFYKLQLFLDHSVQTKCNTTRIAQRTDQ